MPQLSVLSRSLRACYENDRILSKLSVSMETELALNSLVLNELELQPDEVSSLCRFLAGKEAVTSITTLIIVSKPVPEKAGAGGKAAKRVRNLSLPVGLEEQASSCFPDRLLKAAIAFIGKSSRLHTVVVDSVRIRVELLASMGEALSTSKSVVRWLSFKASPVGNPGIKVLGPHIGKMQLQVLVFERCGLSDEACSYIANILKCQEAMLDTLFWNTTLRSDPTAISSAVAARQTEETDLVFSQGLVALSLMGNSISDKGVSCIRRAIRSNHWLLGLNLANNKIEEGGVELLVSSLKGNNALHALLLKGNPGFSVDAAQSLTEGFDKAPRRLTLMPRGVSMLLSRWIKLQAREHADNADQSLETAVVPGERLSPYISEYIKPVSETKRKNGLLRASPMNGTATNHDSDVHAALNGMDTEEDSEYQAFQNDLNGEEMKRMAGEGSHLNADQSWADEEEGEGEDSEVLDMGSDAQEDLEDLSTGVLVGVQSEKTLNDTDTCATVETPDMDCRPPSRISLRPRAQSLVSDFLPSSHSNELKASRFRGSNGYQPYLSGTDNGQSGSPIPGHGSKVPTQAWPSDAGQRPSSAAGTGRRGERSLRGRSDPLSWSNGAPSSAMAEGQEGAVSSSGRHSMDGYRPARANRPKSNSRRSVVCRQADVCRRLTNGESSSDQVGSLMRAKGSQLLLLEKSIEREFAGPQGSALGDRGVRRRSEGYYTGSSSQGLQRGELLRCQQKQLEREIENRSNERQLAVSSPTLGPSRRYMRSRSHSGGRLAGSEGSHSDSTEHRSLGKIISHFNESVRDISMTLLAVSAQLQDVNATFNESIMDRSHQLSRSQSLFQANGSPSAFHAHHLHDHISSSGGSNGALPGSGSRTQANGSQERPDSSNSNGHDYHDADRFFPLDSMAQTQGRTRGSHPPQGESGFNLFEEEGEGFQSPDREPRATDGPQLCDSQEAQGGFHSSQPHSFSMPREKEGDVISEADMASLIREGLRKKLADILRPNP